MSLASYVPPPDSVERALRECGFEQLQVGDNPPLWRTGAFVGTWEEALARVSSELVTRRKADTAAPKRFWKTSEFWGLTTTVLSALGAGAALLMGYVSDVPDGYREMAGVALVGVATWASRGYAFARQREKALAELERASALNGAAVALFIWGAAVAHLHACQSPLARAGGGEVRLLASSSSCGVSA